MMTQEEFMDVMAMKRQGLSIKEIAEEPAITRAPSVGWLKAGRPPAVEPAGSAGDRRGWADRIAELFVPHRACWPPACSI